MKSMRLIRTAGFVVIIAGLSSTQLFGQDVRKFSEINTISLERSDFEEICTLESTGTDVFYYLSKEEARTKTTAAVKTSNFEVDYVNGEGAPPWPNSAINAFEYAVDIWETYLDSDINIRVRANWVELGERVLGSAGPTLLVQFSSEEGLTWYPIALASAITGRDFVSESQDTPNETDYDINVNINSAFDDWYFGTDAQPPEGFIDFVTVVLHEIGHGVGFTGSVRVQDDAQTAQWGFGIPAVPLIYDRFTVDGNGVDLLDESIYPNPSSNLYQAVTGRRGGVHFAGFNAIVSINGELVKLYAPGEWAQGSSYSHVDQSTYTNTVNALMRPRIDRAFAIHSPGPAVCGIFSDTGWSLGEDCQTFIGSKSQVMVDNQQIDFGVTNSGESVHHLLTISNDDNAEDALVGRLRISAGTFFSVSSSDQIIIVPPGSSTDVRLLYQPADTGIRKGELEIIHNANNIATPIKIALKGEALKENKLFKLDQNYPNPFNAETNITYALTQTSHVRLEVYDALGRHVQTLVDEEKAAGRHIEKFRANDLSSGLFLYRIVIEGDSRTGKLLLTK